MTYLIIFMIISVIIMFVFIMKFAKQEKLPKQSIIAFTGTLGSGKTYMAVQHAVKAYNKQRLKHRIYVALRILPFRNKIKCINGWKYPATMFSNIPIRIGSNEISQPLKKEHLLEKGLLPERCVVMIDEIGAVASQWDYDNPYVLENLEKFIRFFRHWLNGKMFVTDQVASNIVKPIRARLGMIYNLHDFKRVWAITPFFKVTAIPLLVVEDSPNMVESSAEEKYKDIYFMGYLPYTKNEKNKRYETRCYKPIYTHKALRDIDHFEDDLYTRYLIDVSVSLDVSREYNKNKAKYKEYLYSDKNEQNSVDEFADIDLKNL